jgi:hypothetical protein
MVRDDRCGRIYREDTDRRFFPANSRRGLPDPDTDEPRCHIFLAEPGLA